MRPPDPRRRTADAGATADRGSALPGNPKVATAARPAQVIRHAPPRRGPQKATAPTSPAGTDAANDLHRALAGWTALLGKEPIDPTKRGQS